MFHQLSSWLVGTIDNNTRGGLELISDDYLAVAIFAILALLIPPLVFFMSRFIRPMEGDSGTQSFILGHSFFSRTNERSKHDTYECGEEAEGDALVDFHFQYYLYGIIFVAADILTVFLLLWGVGFDSLSDWAKLLGLSFLGILLIGIWYALRKEAVVHI